LAEDFRHINEPAGTQTGMWGAFGQDAGTTIAGSDSSYAIATGPSGSVEISNVIQATPDPESKVKVHIMLPRTTVYENTSFTAHVQFRNGRTAATPTSVRYRVDCLETGEVIQPWTTVSDPQAQMYIPIVARINESRSELSKLERKQLTVEANSNATTAHRDKVLYRVENIRHVEAA